jgi:serine/threonine protein kinase
MSGVVVAVKKLKAGDAAAEDLKQEAEVMSRIPYHPNVVTLLGYCVDPICVICEFIDGSTNLKRYEQ